MATLELIAMQEQQTAERPFPFSNWPWQHWAHCRPHEVAVVAGNHTLSWSQLARQVDELAQGFYRQGVYRGCCVAIKTGNSEQAVLAWLALLQCGARVLTLNPQLPGVQTAVLLPALNIEYALTLTGDPVSGISALTLLYLEGEQSGGWQPDALATLTLTSGSGGPPKAAAHTLRAHLYSAHGVVTKMNFTPEDRWLLSLPLYHVSGQGIIWRWLLVGAKLMLAGDAPLHQVLELSTFASLVPTQLWRLLQQPRLPEELHNVLLGGAAIPETLTQQAEAAGIVCWCGYGMTETASTVTAKKAGEGRGVGHPLPGHRVRVVDGEVQVQSPALACGYWWQGGLLPLAGSDGWFFTRDGGDIDTEGLHLNGRLDNQFFSAGEGIQPEQIEAVLMAHPAVGQIFIVPKEDREFGHRPVALVTLKTGGTLSQLEAWSKTQLAGFQRPVSWYVLPELNSGGIKISRQRLKEWVARQGTGKPHHP